jgi:hypothetical protein
MVVVASAVSWGVAVIRASGGLRSMSRQIDSSLEFAAG